MDYAIYLILAPFIGFIVLILLILTLQKSEQSSAKDLARFVGSAFAFLVSNYLELVSTAPPWKVFWAGIEHVAIALLVLTWLLFVFEITGRTSWKRLRRFGPFCIPGLADVVLTFTNGAHRLIWREIRFVAVADRLAMQVEQGSAYYTLMIFNYSLLIGGLLLVKRELRSSFGMYRRQLLLISIGMLIALSFNLVYVLNLVPGLRKDYTPIGFALAAIAFVLAIRKARFLELMSAPRSGIFDALVDGVIVIDGRNRIIDLNKTAMALLDVEESKLGHSVYDCPVVAELVAQWDGFTAEVRKDVTVQRGDRHFHYEARLCRCKDERSTRASAIIGLHDVTERVHLIDEVRTLRGIVPICAGCKKIRTDEGYWQQVELYVEEHSYAAFSHGLCPECFEKYYPEKPGGPEDRPR